MVRNTDVTREARLKWAAVTLSFIAMTAGAGGGGAGEKQLSDEQQAIALVQQYAGQLKPRLLQAINEGGPVHAIAVCASEAPAIAAQLSAQSGWQVTRVSSRNRNPAATPDAWERAAIATFERQINEGVDPATLKLGEVTAEGYRFAKPQIVEPLCLNCHGQHISPEVASTLAVHYPEDSATGYQLGQIRGIFSLRKPD